MIFRRVWTPSTTRLLQLALTLLVAVYVLLIGGTLAASLVFQAQLLNFVGAAGLGLGWLLLRLIQRRRLHFSGLEVALLIFSASQWITTATSAQPRLSLAWAAVVLAWIAAFVIISDLLANGWPRVYFFNAMLVVAVILVAHGLWAAGQWFGHWTALGVLPPVPFRYDGLLGQANLTACVLNLLWPIILVRALQAGRAAVRLSLGALVAGLLVVEFFTSSRAGWIAAGAALVAVGVLLIASPGGRRRLARLLSGWRRQPFVTRLASVAAGLVAALAVLWLLWKETQQITHGELLQSRTQFWGAAWSLFIRRPLTGVGPDTFPWFYSRFASIPPEFFAPHAHSLILQILSGSGLLGLAALALLAGVVAWRLWRQWLASGRSVEIAGLIAALMSLAIHLLFDLPDTLLIRLLVGVIVALALVPHFGPGPRAVNMRWAAPLIALPLAVMAFILYGASGDAAGLALAQAGQWPAAAQKFEQTAQFDPGLTLYWEEAAYADTRAGDNGAAVALWQRAIHDDPNWALLPANLAAISHNLPAAQAAVALAPESDLFAINAGSVAEATGDAGAAAAAYQRALALRPASQAALFWQQTPLRQQVLAGWLSEQPLDTSALGQAQQALAAGDLSQAAVLFDQARRQHPDDNRAYLGLAQTALNQHDYAAADKFVQAGLSIPVVNIADTIGLYRLDGDLAAARGQRANALFLYASLFRAIDDYDIGGPGTYGNPQRTWIIFHREGLPGEIVPQMARADITAVLDDRFAQLAQADLAAGQSQTACHILERVYREAPVSESGRLYLTACPPPQS